MQPPAKPENRAQERFLSPGASSIVIPPDHSPRLTDTSQPDCITGTGIGMQRNKQPPVAGPDKRPGCIAGQSEFIIRTGKPHRLSHPVIPCQNGFPVFTKMPHVKVISGKRCRADLRTCMFMPRTAVAIPDGCPPAKSTSLFVVVTALPFRRVCGQPDTHAVKVQVQSPLVHLPLPVREPVKKCKMPGIESPASRGLRPAKTDQLGLPERPVGGTEPGNDILFPEGSQFLFKLAFQNLPHISPPGDLLDLHRLPAVV